jgi:hypothetical protein
VPPFYERRRFQGIVAVVGLLGAVWGLSGAPPPWRIVSGEIGGCEVGNRAGEVTKELTRSARRPHLVENNPAADLDPISPSRPGEDHRAVPLVDDDRTG